MTDGTTGNQRRPHHRFVRQEPNVPFQCTVLFENAHVIVVDKPHFLATMPRGMWYRNTALIQLRQQLGNTDLIPAHRLDRATAGVVLFVKHVNDRGAYQTKFQLHEVTKTYECLAPVDEGMMFPCVIVSRIVKEVGVLQAYETAGHPNARTLVERKPEAALTDADRTAMAAHPGTAVYILHPRTGKTHQLRVHMNSVGLPIVGDDLYPRVVDRAHDDFSSPLELVARCLELDDPISGEHWVFRSRIPL
ncbi:MAG: pseudouridine synthase [Bifidobacteriaceae bacterium]|nr:23S rRNA pseudouridylate synthase [Aeriscardovia sp.]MEE1324450.1 pseudouridine synthase [Bifidobacteriaceae bacterium]